MSDILGSFGGLTGSAPSLSDLTGSLPNPGSLASLLPKGPPGLNENLGAMQGLQTQIADKIKSGSGGFDSLISKTKTNLGAAAGEIKPPAPNLQDKMKGLMGSISSFNPLAAVQLKDVTTTFPSFDIKGAFSKMGSGNFNFNKDIPNLESVGGKVIEKAAPTLAPSEDPLDLEDAPDAPEVKTPALPVGIGVISNDIMGIFQNIGKTYADNPAKANLEAETEYWNTKEKIEEKAREIGAEQPDWSGGTTDDWQAQQDKNLGTGDINAELSDPQTQENAQKAMAVMKELGKLDMMKAMATTPPGTPGTQNSNESAFQNQLNANAKEFKVGVTGRLTASQSEVGAEVSKVTGEVGAFGSN